MNIFIVRHGESQTNIHGQFCTYTDGDLTGKGEMQAKYCGYELSHVDFKRVYSSHLLRAIRTAEIVGQTDQVLKFEELGEMHGGDYECKTWEEICLVHPSFDARLVDSLSRMVLPGGESYQDVKNRLNRFIKQELKSSELKAKDNILIVSHGITLRILINMLMKGKDEEVNKLHWADNTAITHIEIGKENILHRLLCNKHLVKNGMDRSSYEIWSGKEYVDK